jgi:hypothetical protein
MLNSLFALLAAVPLLTLGLTISGFWLLRRRQRRLRHAWLVGFVGLLVAADEVEELPLPEPSPIWHAGSATPAQHSVEIGGGGGAFQTCAGVRHYGDLGAMYRYSTPISDQTNLTVAAGGYGAYTPGYVDAWSGAGRASVGLEHRWIGGAIGVMAGLPSRADTVASYVLPTASLRIGPRDMVFVDANLFDANPTPLPGPMFEVGAGLAFPALGNKWEPLRFRAGVSGMGVYFAPTIPLGDLGNLELTGAYGDPATWGASARLKLHFAAVP